MERLRRAAAGLGGHPLILDVALAIAVGAVSVMAALGGECAACDPDLRPLDAAGAGLLLLASATLAWRRRFPMGVFVANLVVLGVYFAAGYTEAYTGYSVFVAVTTVAAYRSLETAVWVGVASVGMVYVLREPHFGFELLNVVQITAIAFAIFLGAYLREHWAQRRVLQENARLNESESALRQERALAGERGRIARELHDVVAHSMSVVALQIGGARLTMTRDPARADDALARAEGATREAMAELRRLLEVMQPDAGGEGRSPQPGLDGINGLLENARGSGLRVEHRVEGEPRPLPASLELSLFRIAQESVTNALRHAGPGADLTVVLRYGEGWMELESVNGRSELRAPSAAAGEAGGGRGLVGMRERAEMFGGRVTAEHLPGGGFRVLAHLPVPPAAPEGESPPGGPPDAPGPGRA